MRFATSVILLFALPAMARAESIQLLVQRPAPVAEVYALPSLAAERFSGSDGRALANAVTRELAQLRDIDGSTLFELFDSGAGDGSLTGGADVDVSDSRYVEKRRLCPGSFDPNAKCEDSVKKEVEVNCRARTIRLDADIRVVRASDGRVLFGRDLPQQDEARWCNGDRDPPDIQPVVSGLIRRAAGEAVAGFAPFSRFIPIRIREERKGLPKELAEQFKAAVKATRGDGSEGCRLFAALEPLAPTHSALIFNLALCDEARGEYGRAIDGYRRLGDREAIAAANRASATLDAMEQAQGRGAGLR